jgi:hypothetical protein
VVPFKLTVVACFLSRDFPLEMKFGYLQMELGKAACMMKSMLDIT